MTGEYYNYFDKNPRQSYAMGASGILPLLNDFSKQWVAEYMPNTGIYYLLKSQYENSGSCFVGSYLSGSLDVINTESLSICFDDYNNIWASINNTGVIDVLLFSGSGFLQNGNFQGKSPQLFFNFIESAGSKNVLCFYIKDNISGVFFRSSLDSWEDEKTLCIDLESIPLSINQISYNELDDSRIQVFGLYRDGNGFCLYSKPI